MNKASFILLSLISLAIFGILKVAKAYSGRGLSYEHDFPSSGWNTPRYKVLEVLLEDGDELEFGPYACIKNTSGINKNTQGNPGNTNHDVYASFYVFDEEGDETHCMLNVAGTGPAITSLHLEADNVNYNTHFVGALTEYYGYRLYLKKAWNDTWSGHLEGDDYIFELEANSN